MWAKLDDALMDHPKFLRVGPLGLALWVSGLLYCARNLTDGFIPENKVSSLVQWSYMDPDRGPAVVTLGVTCDIPVGMVESAIVADTLVSARLWQRAVGGYRMHDYLDYQPSRESVMAKRAADAERKVKSRSKVTPGIRRDSAVIPSPPGPGPITEHRDRATHGSVPSSEEPPVYKLPTNVKGSFFGVSASDLEGWKRLYPAVDVDAQVRAMIGWLDANPTRRKTARGMKAFVNGWLSREQNRGRVESGSGAKADEYVPGKETVDEMEARWRKEGIL